MSNLSISKAWDDARPIIARDGRLMFLVAIVTVVLPGTLFMLIAPNQASPGNIAVDAENASGGILLITMLVSLIGIIGSIAISYLALFRGASVGDSLQRGVKRLPTVIGMMLVLLIPAFLLAMIFVVTMIGAQGIEQMGSGTPMQSLSPAAVFGALAFIGVMFFIGVRLMLTTPVIAAENFGPIAVLKRSWGLTRGSFWRLLGFLVLFVVAVLVVMMVVGIVVALVVTLTFGEPEPYSMAALITGLFSTLVQAAITVVYSTIIARVYHQLAGNLADPGVPHVSAEN